jgi:hypothetical protein
LKFRGYLSTVEDEGNDRNTIEKEKEEEKENQTLILSPSSINNLVP